MDLICDPRMPELQEVVLLSFLKFSKKIQQELDAGTWEEHPELFKSWVKTRIWNFTKGPMMRCYQLFPYLVSSNTFYLKVS